MYWRHHVQLMVSFLIIIKVVAHFVGKDHGIFQPIEITCRYFPFLGTILPFLTNSTRREIRMADCDLC